MGIDTIVGVDAYGGDPHNGVLPPERVAHAVQVAASLHQDTAFFVAGNPFTMQQLLPQRRNITIIQGDDAKYGATKKLAQMAAAGDLAGFYTLSKTDTLVPCVHKYIKPFEACAYAFPSLKLMPLLAATPKSRDTAKHDSAYMLDVGAVPEISADNYVAYAHIGRMYARAVGKRLSVRIGLLNIGVESNKGTPEEQEAYKRLASQFPDTKDVPELADRFIGNVEPEPCIYDRDNGMHDSRPVDVIVTDGRQGNQFIKLFSAAAKYAFEELKYEIKRGKPWEKIGGAMMRSAGHRVKARAAQYGVATFPCSEKPVFKGHGKTAVDGILIGLEQLLASIAAKETDAFRTAINNYARTC